MAPGGPLNDRGRLVAALAAATYLAAWAFGTRALYPAAIGLALAVGVGWAWVRVLRRPIVLRRSLGPAEHVEGDDVPVLLEATLRPPAPRALHVVDGLDRLGRRDVELSRHGDGLLGRYVLHGVPRGRYRFAGARAVFEDPFGLFRAESAAGGAATLLVFPRLVDLERLFSEAGGAAQEGGRLLLRRTTGFDLHSVRDYQEGESLRKVHWRTTARRGRLMVKELEDAPHDEVAVLLDANGRTVAGEPPESTFDLQVRAAGSILRVHAVRGRRALLAVTSSPPETRRVASFDGEWQLARELLAAVEPTGSQEVETFLARDSSPAAQATELVVVTASLTALLADALLQRALAHRPVSLVLVHAASFRSADATPIREPLLLRLQSGGVPVVVVRRGDDLKAKLGALPEAVAAHG
jgi:uncharacterized protein (DUF58 family)